jgi:pimeloyl-ACP methyl ester carboxylesterase
MKPVTFMADGERIVGNIGVADNPTNLAFLFLHGWLGRQNSDAAQALAKLGHTSMTYAMRGNSGSEGDITKMTKADFLTDAVVAYDYFREQLDDDRMIGIVGSSFGSYLAVLLTELRDVRCLALRVPANYPDDIFNKPEPTAVSNRKGAYDDWRKKILSPSDNKALRALHSFKGNVLIIESEHDEQVPHQTVCNYGMAVKGSSKRTFVVMRNAPHSLRNSSLQAIYRGLLCDWARKQV